MKKLLYLLPLIVIFFASCGPVLEPPVQIGPGIDTVFYSICEYEAPITAPRFDCKGNKLPNPKVVGWKTETCATVNHIGFNETYLNNLGYLYVGKSASVGPVDPPNSPSPLVGNSGRDYLEPEWFLLLIILILAAVILWKLLRGDFNSKPLVLPSTPAVAVPTPSSSTSGSSSSGGRSSTTQTSSWTEESKMLSDLMKEMKANDINSIESEFPNGLKINMKYGSKKGSIDLRKGSDKSEGSNDKKQ